MFSPEKQQIEICVLKSNLEEIENDILVQRSTIPALDIENDTKYHETIAALAVVHSHNSEIERLKQESVRLTAKRVQLRRHCETITQELDRARTNRSEMEDLLKQEERLTEQQIRSYEEFLREIADRFRKTKVYNNESEIGAEIDSIKDMNIALEGELSSRRGAVEELRRERRALRPRVPAALLTIVGKSELEENLKTLSLQYDALLEKRNTLLNSGSALRGSPPVE